MKYRWLGSAALAAVLSVGSIANAQNAPVAAKTVSYNRENRGQHDGGGRMQKLKAELGITDAQGQQIKAIFEANKAKMKSDRDAVKNAATKEARDAARQQMKADRQAVQAQVNNVLTADQRAKWEAMKQQHMQKRMDKHMDKKGE